MAVQNWTQAYMHDLPQWDPVSALAIKGTWGDKSP